VKIKILPESVYRLIAAGEVIDRPSSVVRELVQNSLDALSSNITLSVTNGGKEMINVIDDGEGMDRDDLHFAMVKHATSKIENFDDLKSVKTYGFRGEALYSIGLVSNLLIESITKDDEIGNLIEADCGKIVREEKSSIEKGTSVVVKDIFKNVPARKRFLKSDLYELKKIEDEFLFHALANENVNFKFIVDGRVIFNLKKNTLENRIREIKGDTFLGDSFKIDYFEKNIMVKGIVGKPVIFNNLKFQANLVFINKRNVFYPQIKKAVYSAFGTQLKKGFTPYILFIQIPPECVDVNVHPMKKEVKILCENDLFYVVNRSVKSGLTVKKVMESNEEHSFDIDLHRPEIFIREEKLFSDLDFYLSEKKENFYGNENLKFWQFQNSYIFVSVKNKLYILDQHAAAERINYEKFLKEKSKIVSQKLLFPFTLRVTTEIFSFLSENLHMMEKIGFSIRMFDNNKILVESVPSIVNEKFGKEDFEDFISEIYEMGFGSEFDQILKTLACKASLKAGTKLNPVEMEELFNGLFKCENPHSCPHGRPTFLVFEMDDFDKWFKRK